MVDFEAKRCLVMAREFYKEISVALKLENLDKAKVMFQSMMEEQISL